MDGRQLLIHPLAALVAHQTRDGHGHGLDDLAVLHQHDAALLLLELLHRKGHLPVVHTHHDEVVGIVGDGERHRARLDAIATQERRGHVARPLVPLHHRHLDDIHRRIADKVALPVQPDVRRLLLGDHAAGQDADHMDMAALEVHLQLLHGEIL